MIERQVRNSPRNLYAVGALRALEKELFDAGRFSRLAENASRDELAGDLSDSKYGTLIKERGLEKGLSHFLRSSFVFLRESVDPPEALCLLFINADVMNFINRVRGTGQEDAYAPGVCDPGWWIRERLPGFFHEAAARVSSAYDDASSAPDAFMEKVCMDLAGERFLPRIKSRAVTDYWRDRVDIRNLLMNIFHRKPFYWSGGSISENDWKDIRIDKEITPKLAARSFMKAVENDRDFQSWEDRLAARLSARLKDMRKITFGVEPAVSYFLSLSEEIRNIRIILAGIDTGTSPSLIREKLNLGYV